MEDEYLIDCLLVYIEEKIANFFSVDSTIDDFCYMLKMQSAFWWITNVINVLYWTWFINI